jgi:hypothetical protein
MRIGFWDTIGRGLGGRGQIRLILQPTMAIILGMRLGVADARQGKPPFLIRLARARHERWKLFRESLSDAVIPLCVALVVDAILQYLAFRYIRPLAAVVVGFLLVWIPFTSSRALTNRWWTRAHRTRKAGVH